MATSPPGLNHIRAQDSLDQLRARLGQEQFDQAQAEAMALSSDEARQYACADGRVPCHQVPAAYLGLSLMSLALATRRAARPATT